MFKLDYMSDTHFDFFFKLESKFKLINFKKLYDPYFKNKQSNILVIGGDIGHYLKQNIELLDMIKKEYGYTTIILVFGNHDYYLVSKSQSYSFKHNSLNKIKYSKELYQDNGYIVLDNNIVEFDNIKIGGCSGWYDGYVYTLMNNMYSDSILNYWKQVSNDSNLIKGIEDFYTLWQQEKPKLDNLVKSDIDIMITHFKPVIESRFFHEKYKGEKTNVFYCFDFLENILNMSNLKYWVYGHTHETEEFELLNSGKKIVCNAFGYPKEKSNEIKTICI